MIQTPSIHLRINAFAELGQVMGNAAMSITTQDHTIKNEYPAFFESLQTAVYHNPWFTLENIAFALSQWHQALKCETIENWIKNYSPGVQNTESKRVVVIMAGNIPLVGFHDFLCTLLAGHIFIGKLSSADKILLPVLAEILCRFEPLFTDKIHFTEETVKDFDAIIATGSNNTSRYFEFYFSKYPHIIRKNRNGVAVLTGNESDETLVKLGSDICTYFGLGCRNVSKVFVPIGYDLKRLFIAIEPYVKVLSEHFKYMNNHSYHGSVYLLNKTPYLDNGVILLTESDQYSSPIAVVYYQHYDDIATLQENLNRDNELIQCIANEVFPNSKTVHLGSTQSPGLGDYADGIDTMEFLIGL